VTGCIKNHLIVPPELFKKDACLFIGWFALVHEIAENPGKGALSVYGFK
jgi:hypothetical protein